MLIVATDAGRTAVAGKQVEVPVGQGGPRAVGTVDPGKYGVISGPVCPCVLAGRGVRTPVTHVLLPKAIWPRLSDAAEVIGAGLEIAALGMEHRQVGRVSGTGRGHGPRLDPPLQGTVRGLSPVLHRRPGRARRRPGDAESVRDSAGERRLGGRGRPSGCRDEVVSDAYGVAVAPRGKQREAGSRA